MSTKAKAKKKTKAIPASLVWFEIPADNLARAKKFYGALFGWKINPFRGMPDFLHIDTGGADASPDGGMMERKKPGHSITQYIRVASVIRSLAKVEKLGGTICVPRTAVPQMGFFAVCQDTEHNAFGLWETNPQAK